MRFCGKIIIFILKAAHGPKAQTFNANCFQKSNVGIAYLQKLCIHLDCDTKSLKCHVVDKN